MPYIEKLARRCGRDHAKELALLGDAAAWIWNHVAAALVGDRSPHVLTRIVDWYHAMQHLWQCAHALHGEGTDAARQWIKPLEKLLWKGQFQPLRQRLAELRSQAAGDAHRQAVESLVTYVHNQGDRLAYDLFRAAGFDISSGQVESACKHLVATRVKRSGMQWSTPGLQHILSLRCSNLNDQWDHLWNHRPLRHAA